VSGSETKTPQEESRINQRSEARMSFGGIKNLITMVFLDLRSSAQDSPTESKEVPNVGNAIKLILICALLALGMLILLAFLFGMMRLKISSYLLCVPGIYFYIYLLFKMASRKGYSVKMVYRLNPIGLKYILPLIIIGIGLAFSMGQIEHLLRSIIEWLASYNMQATEEPKQLTESLTIFFIFGVISVPIMEEVVFRGLLLTSLENSYGIIKAIFYTSLVFGLVHVFLTNAIAIFITSIGTALVVLKTNSIISGIFIHILNNGMSFTFFRVLHLKEYSDILDKISNHVYIQSLLMLLIGIFLFAVGFGWLSRIAKSDKSNLIIKVEPEAPFVQS
jgi:uncharacterized protein